MRAWTVFLTAFSLLGAGCATLGLNAEVARTWETAQVYLPPPRAWHEAFRPADVPVPDRPLPTVVYLHGCKGITGNDTGWAAQLTAAGYAVVMPRSFARKYRPTNCEPSTHTAGWSPEVHDMRQEEIAYTLAKLRELSWIDQRNVFLMGHSEGGLAVALWHGGEFRGHIISSWTCSNRSWPAHDGIWAPARIPVLAISFTSDPWYKGTYMEGSCEAKFGGRKFARQVAIPGPGHFTWQEQEARDAVTDFLRTHTIREARAVGVPR